MKKLLVALSLLIGSVIPIQSGSFVSGATNCPASGNVQVSSATVYLKQLTVTALPTNTGIISLGGTDVTTARGTQLNAASSYNATDSVASINPSSLFFACTVAGGGSPSEAISWTGRQ